jgi:hypothetical protein
MLDMLEMSILPASEAAKTSINIDEYKKYIYIKLQRCI